MNRASVADILFLAIVDGSSQQYRSRGAGIKAVLLRRHSIGAIRNGYLDEAVIE